VSFPAALFSLPLKLTAKNMLKIHHDRMEKFRRAGLYLVTSQALSRGRSTAEIVRAALAGGVRLIQLREKEMPIPEFVRLAEEIRAMTRKADALLIINDRLDVALAVQADGVHLGQDDLPIACARKISKNLIIGASTHSLAEALSAQEAGASYVNIGPLFPTNTKNWNGKFLGVKEMKKIAAAIKIPFTVMGGIKADHIPELVKAGAKTIAVVTAITAAPNPKTAAASLLCLVRGKKPLRRF